jgi:hypothetical protein
MMKRLLLPGYLIFFLCFALYSAQTYAQDSTQKAPTPIVKATTAPPKVKHHYNKPIPAATAPAITLPAAQKPQIVVNPIKTQIDPAQLNDKSLNGQYQYLLTKTYNYQQPLISALWKNVMDTLKSERNKLNDARAKLTAQTKTVSTLQADVTSKDQTLSESNARVDAISLFGIVLPKSTYNLIMCGLVACLAVGLIIVIATTAKYKHEAKYRIELYEEIDEEYKAFKAKANEKEIKLARELQTERNKVDELMGRG